MTALRRLGLPTPTVDKGQQREFLRTTKEILEVAQRQRGDPLKSFVRLEELVQLRLADPTGALLPSLVRTGAGSPEGAVVALVGTLYLRTDGGAGTTLYVKETGVGATGWVAK